MKAFKTFQAASIFFGVLLISQVKPSCFAQELFTLVNSENLANHWPGIDGKIGSADDVVSGTPSSSNGSAPNAQGSLSYNAFDFGMGTIPDANLFPPGRQAMTYLEAGNTVSIDMNAAADGTGPIILGWNVSGSEPFPGHGPFTAEITAVNSGNYNPETKEFSQNVDFSANLLSGQANSSSFDLSGNAWIVEASDFDSGIGDVYVDDVLIPIAKSMNATAMVYLMGTGTVPAADNFGFPEMGITAAIFGLAGIDDNGGNGPLPSLNISLTPNSEIQLSWAVSDGDVILQSNASLNAENEWADIQPPYSVEEGVNILTMEAAENSMFFRLRNNP